MSDRPKVLIVDDEPDVLLTLRLILESEGFDPLLAADGETAAEFEETHRFIASSPLNYLHVFSYSDRPGTPASSMPDHVVADEVRDRSNQLRALGDNIGLDFRRTFVGRALEVLPFARPRVNGRLRALSGNFIEVGLRAEDSAVNHLIRVAGSAVRAASGERQDSIPATAA